MLAAARSSLGYRGTIVKITRRQLRQIIKEARGGWDVREGDVELTKAVILDVMVNGREGEVWTIKELETDVKEGTGRRDMRHAVKPALEELQAEERIGFEGGTVRAYYYNFNTMGQ